MKRLPSYILSARLMTSFCHCLALLLLFFTFKANVRVKMSDQDSSSYERQQEHISLALICIGLFCMMWDLLGALWGYSIYYTYVNLIQICFHFVGGVLVSRYIVESWNSDALLPLILFSSLPTALLEIGILVLAFCFKSIVL